MKTLVLFYSFSGKTKALANTKAQELDADLIQVIETKKRSKFNAYTSGCFQAMKQRKTDLQQLNVDVNAYERIVIMMPIWAGSPAPAFNNVLEMLPSGKQIELIMISASGHSNKEKTMKQVKAQGYHVAAYQDIKS